MSFGDAFDAHHLAQQAQRADDAAWQFAFQYPDTPHPRAAWPDLPTSEAAHLMRQWLDRLTVRDAAFLHALGIDPLG